ncbi:DNA replication and repair protein RecO [Mycoplasma testudineum]|uniref:DNA replication and repair protein RecO n=1 Tax=Mycoplasma testudineum TaxID=244584 RepID=A0A4R6ICU6_9MOLU|nr:recombination protein O N-terminal domain-containing protein [Mycoplasma testudineum]OYD26599.1 hypothetical protein CG473_03105 [Mycoplasma testudineum]TDO19431.1 DNA replication and repair protein RecO [Mycoplasma testudineum]
MSAKQETGILSKIIKYQDQDAILRVFFKDRIVLIYAPGIFKTTSKNRNNLFEGALINFEFFQARLTTKMSRLKTATLIYNWKFIDQEQQFWIPNWLKLLQAIDTTSEEFFNFYQYALRNFNYENNIYLTTYLYYLSLELLGYKQNFNSCVIDKRRTQISNFDLSSGGFLCIYHSMNKAPIEILKSLNYLTKSYSDFLNKTTRKTVNDIYQIFKDFISNNSYLH